jgi:hypothetical protein
MLLHTLHAPQLPSTALQLGASNCGNLIVLLLLPLQVQPLDPVEVLALEGQPVEEGVPVLLMHCATMAPLAVDAGVWA